MTDQHWKPADTISSLVIVASVCALAQVGLIAFLNIIFGQDGTVSLPAPLWMIFSSITHLLAAYLGWVGRLHVLRTYQNGDF